MHGIHCKTLYVWSRDDDFISDEPYRKRVVDATGTGLGGGGGKPAGQVSEVFVKTGGHALPLSAPTETAAKVAEWLRGTAQTAWEEEEAARKSEPTVDPTTVPREWIERITKL